MSYEDALTEDELIPQLWKEYQKTPEYKEKATYSIEKSHYIVIRREKDGLKEVYNRYVRSAATEGRQTPSQLINELKAMHDSLFKLVLKSHGKFRNEDRRIGDPYDDTLKLTPPNEIYPKLVSFAEWLCQLDYRNFEGDIIDKSFVLADIHIRMVMIHPFPDGNGRIARAMTDKYAIKMGLPTALAAHPRLDRNQQKKYHEAIYNSQKSGDKTPMMLWIKGYLERTIERIA